MGKTPHQLNAPNDHPGVLGGDRKTSHFCLVDVYGKKDCNDILVPSVTIIHLHCGPWCGAMGVVVESVIAKFKSLSASLRVEQLLRK